MNRVTPPRPESVLIPGPVGPLEAVVEDPVTGRCGHVAIICHPHPLHGGTLTNKVVHTVARACNELGTPAVRFNYRGVGGSAGIYDDGVGETDDAVAVIDWALERWAGCGLWLAGFSFGAAVALRGSHRRPPARLITIAPPVSYLPVEQIAAPECPWLVVHGDLDELVEVRAVREWVAAFARSPQLTVMEQTTHFFHGRLHALRGLVRDWLGGPQQ